MPHPWFMLLSQNITLQQPQIPHFRVISHKWSDPYAKKNASQLTGLISSPTELWNPGILPQDIISSTTMTFYWLIKGCKAEWATCLHTMIVVTVAMSLVHNPAWTATSALGKERYINDFKKRLWWCIWRHLNEVKQNNFILVQNSMESLSESTISKI